MSNSNSERVEGIADSSTPSLRPLKLITCEYSHVYSMEPVSYASVFLSGNSFINASGFSRDLSLFFLFPGSPVKVSWALTCSSTGKADDT